MSVESAATLMARAAALTQRAAELFAAGRILEAERADREAQTLRQRAFRKARSQEGSGSAALYAPAESERDTVVEGLTELDAMTPARLLADYIAARFSRTVPPRVFSSLRRDERKAWERSSSSRPAFVVPALEGSFFTQVRGTLALSTWPIWRRLMGPRTGRVELLRAARNVVEHLIWIAETDEVAASRMERLVVTLVRTVPGALDGWTLRDRKRTREAVEHELEVLEDDDRRWRDEAAARAEEQLEEHERLWGARVPHLIARTGGDVS